MIRFLRSLLRKNAEQYVAKELLATAEPARENSEHVIRDLGNAHRLAHHAHERLLDGEITEALDDIDKVVAFDPDLPGIRLLHAQALSIRGRHREAIAEFDKAILVDYSRSAALLGRASSRIALGEDRLAIDDMTRVLHDCPDDWNALCDRATAYFRTGQIEAAELDYQAALQLWNKEFGDLREQDAAVRPDHHHLLTWSGLQSQRTLSRLRTSQGSERDQELETVLADLRAIGRDQESGWLKLNNIAWLLATSPDAELRLGEVALEFALRALELSEHRERFVFDTVAAAYAETGDFQQAIAWQMKAHEGYTDDEMQRWGFLLEEYRNHRTCHEPDGRPLK